MRHHFWLAGLLAGGIALPAYSQEMTAGDLFVLLDRNGDGKLEASEIPDGQFRFFERILRLGDRNSDSTLSREELAFALRDQGDGKAETSSPEESGKGVGVTESKSEGKKLVAGPEAGPPKGDQLSLKHFLERFDRNLDGQITREELPEEVRTRLEPIFERLKTDRIPLKTPDNNTSRKEAGPGTAGEQVQVKGDWMGRDLRPGQESQGGRKPVPRLLRLLDKDQNGSLSEHEWAAAPQVFGELDLNRDGELGPFELLGLVEMGAMLQRRDSKPGEEANFPEMLFHRTDANGDGKVTSEEAPPRLRELFPRLDTDRDGSLTLEELRTGLPQLRRDRSGE